jgi:hypothetical protein
MLKSKRFFAVILCLLVFGMALGSPAFGQEKMTLSGTVQMGDSGPVLEGDDGQNYILDGDRIEEMEGKTVTVTGLVEASEDGSRIMIVESIR